MAARAGHAIGTTAIGATLGANAFNEFGAALADIIVAAAPRLEPIEDSLGTIISLAVGIIGGLLVGKFVPSNQKNTPVIETGGATVAPFPAPVAPAPEAYGPPAQEEPTEETMIPEGTGTHRATTPATSSMSLADELTPYLTTN